MLITLLNATEETSKEAMKFSDGIRDASFVFMIVIGVLALLYGFMRLFSFIMIKLEKIKATYDLKKNPQSTIIDNNITISSPQDELKLVNVDEKTAAMIMAIVADESNIPVNELYFKSIKLIEEEKKD